MVSCRWLEPRAQRCGYICEQCAGERQTRRGRASWLQRVKFNFYVLLHAYIPRTYVMPIASWQTGRHVKGCAVVDAIRVYQPKLWFKPLEGEQKGRLATIIHFAGRLVGGSSFLRGGGVRIISAPKTSADVVVPGLAACRRSRRRRTRTRGAGVSGPGRRPPTAVVALRLILGGAEAIMDALRTNGRGGLARHSSKSDCTRRVPLS